MLQALHKFDLTGNRSSDEWTSLQIWHGERLIICDTFVEPMYNLLLVMFIACFSAWRFQRKSWRLHPMEILSRLLALCVENPSVTSGFPSQRPVTGNFDAYFELCPSKRLSKQSRRGWFETPSRSLWRHCNVSHAYRDIKQWSPQWLNFLAYIAITMWQVFFDITETSDGHHSVWNHRLLDCPFNSMLPENNTKALHYWPLVEAIYPFTKGR